MKVWDWPCGTKVQAQEACLKAIAAGWSYVYYAKTQAPTGVTAYAGLYVVIGQPPTPN